MSPNAAIEHLRRLRRDGRLVVIDGGMGSELEAQGAPMDHDAWSGLVNLHDPGLVRRVHEDYVRAGADVLITNTFMSGTGPMERAGCGERFDEANRNAVIAARDAAAGSDRTILIAGSVSATQLGAPEVGGASGAQERRRLRDGYLRQVEVLAARRGRPDRAGDGGPSALRRAGRGGGAQLRAAAVARAVRACR